MKNRRDSQRPCNTVLYGSLFSGIGGFDLGFDRAGMRCAWQVEIDPYCQRVLQKHWPEVPKHDDIRTFNPTPVDVVCGGFPCQDISEANGNPKGITGERSGLWSEYVRIIRDIRPRFVVVENVPAITFRGMGTVVGELAESGYGCLWDCIPAAAVGAPHIRDRMFIIACRSTEVDSRAGNERRLVADTKSNRQRTDKNDPQRQTVQDIRANIERSSDELARRWRTHWHAEPALGRVADGVSNRLDRLRGLGNAVVPQVAEWIGRRLIESV